MVQLPGRLDLNVSVSFSPRAGTVDEESLEATVGIGDCVLHADSLLSFLNALKESDRIPSASITVGKPNSNQDKKFVNMARTSMSSNSFRFSVPSMLPLESPLFSPSLSSRVPSISSITSPASPLIEAISVSAFHAARRGRGLLMLNSGFFDVPSSTTRTPLSKAKGAQVQCKSVTATHNVLRLKPIQSTLSFLQSILVTLSRVNIVYIDASPESEHSYRATMQDISFKVFRSSPVDNPFHVDVLGRRQASEKYDPEVYGSQLSIGSTNVERHTITDVWHVLSLRRLDFQVLVSQWPFPWLSVSPFMSSDPNAAILALRGHAAGATITERLEDLHLLLRLSSVSQSKSTEKSEPSSVLKPFPRIFLQFNCGPVVGSIICKGPDGYKPLVVELKTKGVNLSASSHYRSDTTGYSKIPEHELRCETSLVIEPIFTIVHPNAQAPRANDRFSAMDLVYHPTALSAEMIEIRSSISAAAQIDDRVGAIACVDTSTLTINTHVAGDAFCVELWHPDVVAATLQILTVLSSRKVAMSESEVSKSGWMSPGFSISMGLARLIVFVTSPDLNPQDDLSLSRGIALRSAVSVHSCSLATKHLQLLGGIHEHSLTRQELDLSQDICLEASAATRALNVSTQSQFLRVFVSGLLVRGAVATPVENDDPHIIERDGDAFVNEGFLRMEHAEFKMSRISQTTDGSHIYINIPTVNLDFHLSHVYESMLALQTLRSIQQILSVSSTEPSRSPPALQVDANISNMRIVWALPGQTLLTHIRNLTADRQRDGGASIGFAQVQLSASHSSKASLSSDTDAEHEEELLRLQSWTVKLPQDHEPLEIVADGDNALVRIPFGYVVADLMLDITVVVKALRHIVHMAKAGCYEDFPVPTPEGPKVVPQFKISTRHVSLEVADDPFESQLGLIWRAGLGAVKTRLEREKAFETKVAIIHAAETGSAGGSLPGSTEYRFDASHTISVDEARQRLDEVHTLDWVFRLEQERRKIAQSERAYIQSLRSTIASVAGATSIPDPQVADDTSGGEMPPLFRTVLFDVDLSLSPPSFAFDHLSKFLFEQGNLPIDKLYTLLVPVHIHLTLSAIHATLRDYPLPLFSIPAPLDGTKTAFEFNTDLVIAEELGTDQSVDWVECPLIMSNQGARGVLPFSLSVPKTIMPVKSYANPIIKVRTDRATTFTWGVSYGPVIQDVMRIVDTLTSASRDESPPIGFWDKVGDFLISCSGRT